MFRYNTYALALALLGWMGLPKLCATSATFGADRSKDYLMLSLEDSARKLHTHRWRKS